MKEIKTTKAHFVEFLKPTLTVKTFNNEIVTITCNEQQIEELDSLFTFLNNHTVLNLLNILETDNDRFVEFIILEPDYLIDISALAECFKPYGNHPLNYISSRLRCREITSPILLGNTANFFVDELIYEKELKDDYINLLKKLFKTAAFEFSACDDLKDEKKERDFFINCQKQHRNILTIVEKIFPKARIEENKIILEPSFISNALGLQGRMDILMSDYSSLIELKSGKAVEDFRTGGEFMNSALNHYTQIILYLAILEFNLGLEPESVSPYLLYSKYPILHKENYYRTHLQQALQLRNKIVAYEYIIQSANNIDTTKEILARINSKNLNIANLTGKFFDNYLAPSIDEFAKGYNKLNELEKTYFLRLFTFVSKELWLSKAGEKEYEGIKKASVLWNASFEDKLIAGEILYNLSIIDNKSANEEHSITLQIPEYESMYLPNFRQGDAIVLYERRKETDNVNNRQVFKGSIEYLGDTIKIRLRYRQKNSSVWHPESTYAIEHDYMDSTYVGMYRALTNFVNANQDRKDLLLCQRFPADASECYLLVGPPGTGKTSISLKNMVVDCLSSENNSNILILSYTNRAVDEICKTLNTIRGVDYIRIGSELNCSPEYRNNLLEKKLDNCSNRKEVYDVISNCNIFTGTVASVWNKSELLQLKSFNLCIIDEATQLLEPHLLGILCAKNKSENNAIKRFIMIGDHKQLPAVVLQTKQESSVYEENLNEIGLTDLSNSLFERLHKKYSQEKQNHLLGFLNQQGRMHPDISFFPSKYFYEGKLECVGLPHQQEVLSNNRKRLTFYAVAPSKEEQASKTNINEANEVVNICREIYEQDKENFSPESIGIITPFRNQIALIRKQLQEDNYELFSNIIVDTVERFQGSQRDTIIYSFCIKNKAQLEALPNVMTDEDIVIDRKLNVVLTRARKYLHIVGNEELLSNNELYRELILHIKDQSNYSITNK